MKAIILKIYYFFIETIPKLLTGLSERVLLIFPVRRKRIVFSSFTGKSYSCNPRAIYEYLLTHYGDKFEYVWLFDFKTEPIIPDIVRKHAKCVQTDSYKSKYYKATSGFWIFNHRNTSFFHKRKKQFYIQTWHADLGLKPVDKLLMTEAELLYGYGKKCLLDSSMLDVFLVGSEWGYNYGRRAFFFEDGEFLKIGSPRNDILFADKKIQEQLTKKVKKKFNIGEDVKMCLYAPTFREDSFEVVDLISSDEAYLRKLIECLHNRFGGNWILLTKFHPATLNKIASLDRTPNASVVDASFYPDMADLLVACDVLISDYSSCLFDFGYTGKPCWFLFEDLDEYLKNIKKFVINIDQIGFPIAYSKKELLDEIIGFDENEYRERVKRMYEEFGSVECGKASELISERIVQESSK